MQDKMSIARVPSTIFFGAFSGLLFDFLSEIKLGKRKARKGTLQPHTQIPIAIPHLSLQECLHPRERARPERATAATSTTGETGARRARVSPGSMPPDISTASAQRQTCRRSLSTDPSPPPHTIPAAQVAAWHDEATGRPIDRSALAGGACQGDGQTRGSGTRGRS